MRRVSRFKRRETRKASADACHETRELAPVTSRLCRSTAVPAGPPDAPPNINFIEITSCATTHTQISTLQAATIARSVCVCECIAVETSIWRMHLTAPTFAFPNLRWNKFRRLPSSKPTVLFLGVSRFLRNSTAEDTKALCHYRDYRRSEISFPLVRD